MAGMALEFRLTTLDDYEQLAEMESRAFYNRSSPEMVERMRKFFPPEWTVGAFVDGRPVAATRTIPHERRIHGAKMRFGAVGPVASMAAFRRQGYAARTLMMSLELMRERGQVLSGLHTPHDALYRRYGWERAEFKKHYEFPPKDVVLRFRPTGGHTVPAFADDWPRLDAIFRRGTENRNGPFVRSEVWWRESVMRTWDQGQRVPTDAVVWVDADGQDQGYVVYLNRGMGPDGGWQRNEVWIRDIVALTQDAYLGLWLHMLTHDLAEQIAVEVHPDDPFRDSIENPFKVRATFAEGAMLRVVDVENALAQRPSVGTRQAAVTIGIEDQTLSFNNGNWRIETADGRTNAERTNSAPDIEMTVNTLAPLFTGFLKPHVAASTGFIRVNRTEAVDELAQVFAVSDPPYCPDFY